jgi:putative membrane protein
MNDWYGHDWGWGSWLAMSVMMIGFTAVVVLLVALVVQALPGSRPPTDLRSTTPSPTGGGGEISSATGRPSGSAERVLDERFARGDIDEQEYLTRRDLLRS